MNEQDLYNKVCRTRIGIELDLLLELEVDINFTEFPAATLSDYIARRRQALREIDNGE